MKTFRQLTEAKDTIVFTFGRFNPPTTGHEKLIEACKRAAGSNEFRVYPSFSQNPKKDPLPHSLKVAYMRKMFKKYARNIKADKSAKTAIMIAENLYKEGFKNVIMVAGSDRVPEFTELLVRYNGQPDKKGNILYDFDSLKVVSAGERDPDAEGVEGMSASKMRKAATENEFEAFRMGVPAGFTEVRKLFDDVRKHMGIREERDMGEMDSYEELRDAYLTGKMWNIGESIETEHGTAEVVRKGTNYISYMTEDGKVHKSWLHDIAERNYKKEYANYQGKPEQIERRSSRNKARRAMGDKTVKGMDVGHKDNDPMNNDPKNLRNEDPSKNRREPRLREEDELDERMSDIFPFIRKLNQMTHKKGYGKLVQAYAKRAMEPEYKGKTNMAATDVARETSDVSPRELVDYINKLVKKGDLPKELKAGYEPELDPIVEGLTMMVKGTKTTSQRKYQLTFGQKIKVDGKVWDTEGVTKMQVLPLTDGRDKKVLSKAEIESGLKDGSIEIVDVGQVWQPEEYVPEARMSPLAKLQKFDKSRVAAGKPAIFKDKGKTKYYRMKKPGVMSIMNVPSDELNKYIKQGWTVVEGLEQPSFKDLIERININQYIAEKLPANADQGDYIDDFEKSDAPQFKGKSKEKRKDMAIAAYLSKNETKKLPKVPTRADLPDVTKLDPAPAVIAKLDTTKKTSLKKLSSIKSKAKSDLKKFSEQDEPEEEPDDKEQNVDDLKYEKIEETPVENVDGDWKNVDIEEPPVPSSQAGKDDISSVMTETKVRTEDQENSIKEHDMVATYAIRQYLDENDLEYDSDTITKIVVAGKGIGRYYKNKFQRIRPWDHAEATGQDMDVMEFTSKSMDTPSYPSNHSLQSRMVAEFYGKKYRDHYEGLVKAAEESGNGRIQAGWHYPSDHQAAVKIAETVSPMITLSEEVQEGAYGHEKQDDSIKGRDGSQPAKYFKDMPKSTKSKRDAHFKKRKTGPAPGDADAKTKPSVHTKKFKQMYGEVSEANKGLQNKAEKSGVSYGILKKVYDRGLAAYKGGHRPGTTAPQWAMARVNSFLTGGGARKSDNDLWKQTKKEETEYWNLQDACWQGFKQVGMKKKGNKEVPNCVPEETDLNEWDEIEEASEYQGRKVTLNKPFYTPDGPKKSSVYVNNAKGNVVKVNFGDPNMEIKVDDPGRRKNFRARHNCDSPGPKWKARYWSCKAW